jgi:hypothetical protein
VLTDADVEFGKVSYPPQRIFYRVESVTHTHGTMLGTYGYQKQSVWNLALMMFGDSAMTLSVLATEEEPRFSPLTDKLAGRVRRRCSGAAVKT